MVHGRIALATLATIVSGIALGLAVHPTLRTAPEADWRARYRIANPAPPPAPQPGVSYFGDGSTAWAWGGAPVRIDDSAPPMRQTAWRDEPERWAPPPPPDPPRDDYDADSSASERAAAQAAVSAALVRLEPRAQEPADSPPPAEQEEPAAEAVMEN